MAFGLGLGVPDKEESGRGHGVACFQCFGGDVNILILAEGASDNPIRALLQL